MAAQQPAGAEGNVRRDPSICEICMMRMTDPRVLQCGHTYCLNCVRTLYSVADGNRTMRCPNHCRAVQNPPAADQWPKNFGIIDSHNVFETSTQQMDDLRRQLEALNNRNEELQLQAPAGLDAVRNEIRQLNERVVNINVAPMAPPLPAAPRIGGPVLGGPPPDPNHPDYLHLQFKFKVLRRVGRRGQETKTEYISFHKRATIGEVKRALRQKLFRPPARLVRRGLLLADDNQTLEHYGINRSGLVIFVRWA